MKNLISIAVLCVSSLAVGGCAVQPGDESSAGETENAFSANWNYSWGDTKPNTTDIGTSVGRTCFLTGVGGNFRPGGTIWDPPGAYHPAWGGVRINAQNRYEIYVSPSAGHSMIVQARCVNSAANRVTGQWNSVGADVKLGATTAHRQCFLTEIGNISVNSTNTSNWAFTNTSDFVRTYHDNVNWYVGGNLTSGGWALASAVCVDAPEHIGDYNGGLAPKPGTSTKPLSNVAGATCGLTKVQGSLEASFGDWNDEVSLTVPAGSSQFTLTAKNGKAGSATCMK